jgi:hypothetical protein
MRGANAVAHLLLTALAVLLYYSWPTVLWFIVHVL